MRRSATVLLSHICRVAQHEHSCCSGPARALCLSDVGSQRALGTHVLHDGVPKWRSGQLGALRPQNGGQSSAKQGQQLQSRGFASLGGQDVDEDIDVAQADVYDVAPTFLGLQRSQICIDEQAPDFSSPAVVGNEITTLSADTYRGQWVLLFFYPKDFTFVCPTEIIAFNDRAAEFEKRNCAVIGASCDSAEVHLAWMRTPRKQGGLGHMEIPLLADVTRRVSADYGVLNSDNVTNRGMFLISPEGKLKSMQINQNDVGRSVDEAIRLLDAYQFVAEHGVVCPADWKPGSATMVADPDKSLDYFAEADSSKDGDAEFGQSLLAIRDRAHYKQLTSGEGAVVVDFMAGWCGKCRMISPHVESLQRKHPDIKFVKFDTTNESGELDKLSAELSVKALPAFRFFLNGKEVLPEVTGYKKRPLEEAVTKLASMTE